MELKELYQEIILDHAKNPRNKGKCEGYNHDAKAHNPLCGDKVHIYLKLDNNYDLTLAQNAASSYALYLAGAGNVYLSIDSNNNETDRAFIVQKDAIKASKIMGVKDIEFLDFPDNEMDKKSNLEITKKIESIICHFPPQLLFFFEINTQESTNKKANIFFRASTPGKKTNIAASNKNLRSTAAILFIFFNLKIKNIHYKQSN